MKLFEDFSGEKIQFWGYNLVRKDIETLFFCNVIYDGFIGRYQ